jgi:hypothetical protein
MKQTTPLSAEKSLEEVLKEEERKLFLAKMFEEMTIEELQKLNSRVVSTLKQKRATAGLEIALKLEVGQVVEIKKEGWEGIPVTITAIKRTRASVKTPNGDYNVPFSMIKIEHKSKGVKKLENELSNILNDLAKEDGFFDK